MSRLFIIGDIHGYRIALVSLLEWIGAELGDTIITLGDHISGGPDSKGVIEELISLRAHTQLIPLLGNHELLMLGAIGSHALHENWLHNGGDTVLASYRTSSIDDIPALHWDFLRSCQRYYEDETFICVHGIVKPEQPMDLQPDGKLFWDKLTGNLAHYSGKTIICGHTPQLSGVPLQLDTTICIDTNIKGGGWLTCLEPSTCQYWQTNEAGERRNGILFPIRPPIPRPIILPDSARL